MSEIQFNHVYKSYEEGGPWAIEDIVLTIPARSFVVFLGPSGCGKTTLLKMVNRLQEPTKGEILVDGTDIRNVVRTDLRREMGYSIQQPGLFPHMTVGKNIGVVPNLLNWSQDRINKRVLELLALMNLDPDIFLHRYPAQLSGGEQQRVGIARALAADPKILLMDEPFGALDAITRTSLQGEIAALHRKLKKTVLFVTHDVDEALRLADYIAVMRDGKLIQFESPVKLLNAPADGFVAELLNIEDRIRQISLITLEDIMEPVPSPVPDHGITIDCNQSVREALSLLLTPDTQSLLVIEDGQQVGWVTLETIQKAGLNG
jgi:osmoprotectant transport system ATP-binding protein